MQPSRSAIRASEVSPSLPPAGHVVQVMAGGALGAAARLGFSTGWPVDPGAFPFSTFAENILGAFLLALLLSFATARRPLQWDPRPLFGTGLLGAFTTFSTFTGEVVELLAVGAHALASAYAGLSLACGLVGAALGLALGTWLGRRT